MKNKAGLIICIMSLFVLLPVAAYAITSACIAGLYFYEYRIEDFDLAKPYYQYVADRLITIYDSEDFPENAYTNAGDICFTINFDRESKTYSLSYNMGSGRVEDRDFCDALRKVVQSFDSDSGLEDVFVSDSRVEFRNIHGNFAVVYAVDGKKPDHLFCNGVWEKAKRVINEKDDWYQVFI